MLEQNFQIMNTQRLQEISEKLNDNHRRICAQNAAIGVLYSGAEQILMSELLREQTELLTELRLLVGVRGVAPLPQMSFTNGKVHA